MIVKKTIFFQFLFFLVFVSCSRKKNSEVVIEKIKGNKVYLKDDFVGQNLLFAKDSLLAFYSYNSLEPAIVKYGVIDERTLNQVRPLVNRGRGPFEIEIPFFSYNPYDDSFNFINFQEGNGIKLKLSHEDKGYKERLKFPLEDKSTPLITPTKAVGGFVFIDNHTVMFLGGSADIENILSLYDFNEKKLKPLNFWVEDNVSADIFNKQLAYTTNSTLFKHPSENKFLYACGIGGEYVEIFDLNKGKITNREKLLKETPKYVADGLDIKISEEERTKPMGIKIIIPTEKYIYVMKNNPLFDKDWKETSFKGFSNRHNDLFLVYDWEGNYLKNVEIEIPGYDFCWDQNKKILYSITESKEKDILMSYHLD